MHLTPWAHPRAGRPNWSPRNRMQTRKGREPSAKRVTASSSTSDSDSDPVSNSSSSSAMEWHKPPDLWIEVRTQFRPRVRGRSSRNTSVKPSTTRNWNVNEICSTERCRTLSRRETLKGLVDRPVHHDHEELECQRALLRQALLNSVPGRKP